MPFILKLVFPKIFLNISFAPPFSVSCYFYRFVFIIVCRGILKLIWGLSMYGLVEVVFGPGKVCLIKWSCPLAALKRLDLRNFDLVTCDPDELGFEELCNGRVAALKI